MLVRLMLPDIFLSITSNSVHPDEAKKSKDEDDMNSFTGWPLAVGHADLSNEAKKEKPVCT